MTLGYHFFSRTSDAERVKKKTAERLQRKKIGNELCNINPNKPNYCKVLKDFTPLYLCER